MEQNSSITESNASAAEELAASSEELSAQAQELQGDTSRVKTIYLEQQQAELSSCIIGANPSAVAKSLKTIAHAHKAGVLSDADLDTLSLEYARVKTADSTIDPAGVEKARQRARMVFLMRFEQTKRL